jgi:hypothetical protein
VIPTMSAMPSTRRSARREFARGLTKLRCELRALAEQRAQRMGFGPLYYWGSEWVGEECWCWPPNNEHWFRAVPDWYLPENYYKVGG